MMVISGTLLIETIAMHVRKKFLILGLLLSTATCFGQTTVVDKAVEFLSTLSPELLSKTVFDIRDNERFNWHFVPLARKGTTLNDYNEKQRRAALELLRASVSQQGHDKIIAIMELERVLMIIEKQSPESHYRDPLNYHFYIFGEPSNEHAWGWRLEGHHCSISLILDKGKIVSSTPSFFGSNPGIVATELQRGKEVLKQETDLGFRLINSLSGDQQRVAIFAATAPSEIISGNRLKAEQIEPRGIGFTELSPPQQKSLLELLDVYLASYETGFSSILSDKIRKAGVDKLSFAWAGSLKPGVANYYRIQGPTLLIEYDNTQNNANHVHTVVRDFDNDFGEDVLREHYRKEH